MLVKADYLQPKLLGILAFFNMQLLSSSAGEKEKKKMVRKLGNPTAQRD